MVSSDNVKQTTVKDNGKQTAVKKATLSSDNDIRKARESGDK